MKAVPTNKMPKFNLLNPDGERPQTDAENITDVLLNDGHWYEIKRGSFKFYKTGDKGVPFVQFDVTYTEQYSPVAGRRVEVFPASVCGIAYAVAPEALGGTE